MTSLSKCRDQKSLSHHCQKVDAGEERSQSRIGKVLNMFIEEFLRLVNFGSQVWAAAAIGVVEQHELAVVLADLVLGQGSFTERHCQFWHIKGLPLAHTRVVGSGRLPDGSCAVRILCNTTSVSIPYDNKGTRCSTNPL